MQHKYYGFVKELINKYRKSEMLEKYRVLNRFVTVEIFDSYTRIWFCCKDRKAEECRKILHEMANANIIRIESEGF